jgi:hypothetical protein
VAVLSLLVAPTVRAQGNLSQQGLGFPPGQFSTRALGTAGAIGEVDPLSPINPAALSSVFNTVLSAQAEPEFRSVSTPSSTDKTTTARFTLFGAVIPIGTRWVIGAGSSTLLDRTWTTTSTSVLQIGTDTVTSSFTTGSDGAINDLRVAASWTPAVWLRLGLGGHAYSGSNLVFQGRTFANPSFANFSDTTQFGVGGEALSAGMELVAPKIGIATISYRKGGSIKTEHIDTTVASARIPDRVGFSLVYTGVTGAQIAARTAYSKWSSLQGLVADGSQANSSWDTSIGAEVTGPRFGSNPFMLRAGTRFRDLPFSAAGNVVHEQSYNFGTGTLFAGGRMGADLALLYSRRKADLTVSERAWTLSLGFSVRP